MVEFHFADDRTQRGHDHVADRLGEILNAVDRLDRVRHLDEGDGVDHDHRVVTGDDFLLLNVEDDVLGGDFVGDRIEVRNDEAQTGQQGHPVLAQTLHDPFLTLRNDAHAGADGDEHENQNDQRGDGGTNHATHYLLASTLMK